MATMTADSSRITDIEWFRAPPRWLFVLITTADGLKGWGEATLEGHSEAVEGALQDLKSRFIGADSSKIEDIWQVGYRSRFYRGGPVLMSAMSGLDIALWDLLGKRLNVPVHTLLGGRVRSKLRVYGWIGGDSPSDVVNAARARVAQGFTAVKMNATGNIGGWVDEGGIIADAVERVKAVKETGIDVGVDFHGRVRNGLSRRLIKALEGLMLFAEEPLLPTQPIEISHLATVTSTPIALGERLYTRSDFRPYFENGAVHIAQPDVSHCGGISEMRRIASYAEVYDVGLAPHCPLGPIALAACMQVGLASPNFVIQEMSLAMHYNTDGDLLTYLADPSVFEVKGGYVEALEGVGLGIEVNEEKVREAAQRWKAVEGSWRNPVWRGEDGSVVEW